MSNKKDAMNNFQNAINKSSKKKEEDKKAEERKRKEQEELERKRQEKTPTNGQKAPGEEAKPKTEEELQAEKAEDAKNYNIYDDDYDDEDENDNDNNPNSPRNRRKDNDKDDNNNDNDNTDQDNNTDSATDSSTDTDKMDTNSTDNDNKIDDSEKSSGDSSKDSSAQSDGTSPSGQETGSSGSPDTGTSAGGNTGTITAGETEATTGASAAEAGGTAGAAEATTAEAGAATTAAVAGGPPLWVIILVIALGIIAAIIVIGYIGFFINGVGLIREKLGEFADTIWTGFTGFFVGADVAQVKDEQIYDIATYLEDMQYDLVNHGFLDTNGKAVTKEENEDGGETIKSGNKIIYQTKLNEETGKLEISKLESKYIKAYLAAENNTYMIANQHWTFTDIFFTPIADMDEWGTGMIHLENASSKVKIDRENKKMQIKYKGYVYQYDLDGWTGRYRKILGIFTNITYSNTSTRLCV